MKTLGGYVCVRNGVDLDYCFQEAVMSLLPVCDEVVVCDSDSTDGARDAIENLMDYEKLKLLHYRSPKIRLINWPWTDPKARSHHAWVEWLNFARSYLTTDCQITLDADEVLDDNPLCHQVIRDALQTDNPCRTFDRLNFWRDPHSLIPDGHCCGKFVTRMGWTKYPMVSDEPHHPGESQLLDEAVRHPDLKIFHLGFLRPKDKFYAKARAVSRIWQGDSLDPRLVKGEQEGKELWETDCDYSDKLVPYNGPYPASVKAWLRQRGHIVQD